jgi:glycosyltransferase involved in cell wall biosynthesis
MPQAYLIVHDSLSPDIGGGTQRLLSIADALVRRGISVSLIGPSEKNEIHGLPVKVVLLPKKGPLVFLQVFCFNLKVFQMLCSRQTPQPKLIVHSAIGAMAPAFLHKWRGQPFFLDLTDIHSEYIHVENCPRLTRVLKALVHRVELAVIGQADRLTLASTAMKDYLVASGISADRMVVVPDGANLPEQTPIKTADAQRHVLHVSHTDYLTEADVMLRAIPLVLEQCPETVFDFVVRGQGVAAMKVFVQSAGLSKAVRWHAPRPREQLNPIFDGAVIGIIQRRDMTANHLVVTGKLFDYWAHGLAVISTRLRGIQEIAQDRQNVLFCAPGSPKALADAIIEVLNNSVLRETLAREGQKSVQRYPVARQADAIVDTFLKS